MRLYHGSTVNIGKIDLSLSLPNKDFGRGFYLSEDFMQAKAMATFKARILGLSPVMNVYDFDESALSILNVLQFSGYNRAWAEFVFANRTSPDGASIHDYDIVYGPIANDRVGLQVRRLMENDIDFDTFLEKLKYMKGVTFQYFFGTERALQYLRKL